PGRFNWAKLPEIRHEDVRLLTELHAGGCMRKKSLGLTIAAVMIAALTVTSIPAFACGDKLVGLNHGAHYMNMSHPGVILVFAPAGSSAAALVTDEQFKAAIKKDKHVLRIATDEQQLMTELGSAKLDVVVTDAKNAAEMQHHLQAHSSSAVIVPVAD